MDATLTNCIKAISDSFAGVDHPLAQALAGDGYRTLKALARIEQEHRDIMSALAAAKVREAREHEAWKNDVDAQERAAARKAARDARRAQLA